MNLTARIARVAALGVVAFMLGCMSDNAVTNPPVQTQAVNIKSFAFNPVSATVSVGSTVTWTNQDAVAHTVTGDGFDSGSLAQNATFSHTFTTKGTFAYHCIFHANMIATVTVQ